MLAKILYWNVFNATYKIIFCIKIQYGFRKQHSTQHAVLEVVDRISTYMDIGNTPIAIYNIDTNIHQLPYII